MFNGKKQKESPLKLSGVNRKIIALVFIGVIILTIAFFVFNGPSLISKLLNKPVDTSSNNDVINDENDNKAIKKQLVDNPLPADASAEKKSAYYNDLISVDYELGDKNSLKVYEEALANNVEITSDSAQLAAMMYVKQGNLSAARLALDNARRITNNQPPTDDPDGGKGERLSDIDALQKELGL